VSREERFELTLGMAEALELGGRVEEADVAYCSATRLAGDTPALLKRRAAIRELQGKYIAAVRLIHRGLGTLASIPAGPRRDTDEAQLLNLLAGVRFRQGNLQACAEIAARAAEAAHRANDPASLGHAHYLRGHALGLSGDRRGRRHMGQALQLLDASGDLVRLANVLNNLGVASYYEGELGEAISFYERSRNARLRAGDVIGAATQENNIAEALSDMGRLDEAGRLFRQARATWRAARYPIGIAIATGNLGRLATRRGEFAESEELLGQAVELFANLGAEDFVLQTRTRIAENRLAANDPEAALSALADSGLAQLASANVDLHLVRGRALAALGRMGDAKSEFLLAGQRAREAGAGAELATIAGELARLE
jgi:tetratricopeptide (TPR) repeat protein